MLFRYLCQSAKEQITPIHYINKISLMIASNAFYFYKKDIIFY